MLLSDKQHLAVFRERPHLVVDHQLKFVDMVADCFHLRYDIVMVGDCFLSLAFDAVGVLAGVDHLLNILADFGYVFRQLFDGRFVAGGKLLGLFRREDSVELGHILNQDGLVAGGDRHDMVEGEVSKHTCLNLDFLGVGLPFHLIASPELQVVEHTGLVEHLNGRRGEVGIEDFGNGSLAVKPALLCLLFPFV